jgi:hypothetical protein
LEFIAFLGFFIGLGILLGAGPAIITGMIAFFAVKKFGKLGYWVFATIVGLCLVFILLLLRVASNLGDAQGMLLVLVLAVAMLVITIGAIIGVRGGLSRSSGAQEADPDQLPDDNGEIALDSAASELVADILQKLPDGAASTKIGGSFECQGETVRVVEAGYVVGGTVFRTLQDAIAFIGKKHS